MSKYISDFQRVFTMACQIINGLFPKILGNENPTLQDANELLAQLPEAEQKKFLAKLERKAQRGDE